MADIEIIRTRLGAVRQIWINGKKIDMAAYRLAIWLGRYNRLNETNLKPTQITDEMVQKFLEAGQGQE